MQKDALAGDDLAQLLGVSSRTLRNWRRERRGPKCEIVGLQASYPITSLIPWLKKYRPDIDLEPEALLRYRQAKKAERQNAEHDPWAEFIEGAEEELKRHQAYGEPMIPLTHGQYRSSPTKLGLGLSQVVQVGYLRRAWQLQATTLVRNKSLNRFRFAHQQ